MKLFWGLNEIRTHTTGLLNRSSTIITIRPDWYGNSVVWRLSAVYRRSAYQIYLLNYTIKVIIISLAVVFHLTSSVSVFCMLLYQYVKDRFDSLKISISINWNDYIKNHVDYLKISISIDWNDYVKDRFFYNFTILLVIL